MTPNMLTSVVAAGICAAAIGPFLLERLLSRRGDALLRLAERVQEQHRTGFVNGCGPVRRATVWDVREAEERIACTAWRAAVIFRPRNCRERREAQRQMKAPRRRHPRHCARRQQPADWWPTFPKRRVPAGMTPLQAVVEELRGAAS